MRPFVFITTVVFLVTSSLSIPLSPDITTTLEKRPRGLLGSDLLPAPEKPEKPANLPTITTLEEIQSQLLPRTPQSDTVTTDYVEGGPPVVTIESDEAPVVATTGSEEAPVVTTGEPAVPKQYRPASYSIRPFRNFGGS